jgi:hypothetical protein
MNYFPHNPLKTATDVANALGRARPATTRDVRWNKPVFKAPALANPPVNAEPLPFTAARVTLRGTRHA